MMTALRAAGLDAVQSQQPSPTATDLPDLNNARLVVVSGDAPLPDGVAAKIAAFVRGGGGMLVVHTAGDKPNYWWETYRRQTKGSQPSPLWMRFHLSARRWPKRAASVILSVPPGSWGRRKSVAQGRGFETGASLPVPHFHDPADQSGHSKFARDVRLERGQYKSPLWGNGQVLAWGDDPEQRPLLLSAHMAQGVASARRCRFLTKHFCNGRKARR